MEEPAGPVLQKTELNSLAIQSRKALLLKGEKEAKISNAILHKVITSAIPEPVGGKLISLVNTRDEIPDLLKLMGDSLLLSPGKFCQLLVFHQDAHLWTLVKVEGARDMAVLAQESPRQLRAIGSEDRRNFLLDLADALDANEGEIIAEKEADVAAGYEKAMISRLALKPWKISALAKSMSKLANSEQPFGRALKETGVRTPF